MKPSRYNAAGRELTRLLALYVFAPLAGFALLGLGLRLCQNRPDCATCAELATAKTEFDSGLISSDSYDKRRSQSIEREFHRRRLAMLVRRQVILEKRGAGTLAEAIDLCEVRLDAARSRYTLGDISAEEFKGVRNVAIDGFKKHAQALGVEPPGDQLLKLDLR